MNTNNEHQDICVKSVSPGYRQLVLYIYIFFVQKIYYVYLYLYVGWKIPINPLKQMSRRWNDGIFGNQ